MVTIAPRQYHIMCANGFIDWSKPYDIARAILESKRLDELEPQCAPHTVTAKKWRPDDK